MSCRRLTNRWTLNTFFYILDILAYNSYVLYKIQHPDKFESNSNRQRRVQLEMLAINLINPCMNARVEIFSTKNFSGCQSPVVNSFKKAGATLFSKLSESSAEKNSIKADKRQYCHMCVKTSNATRIKILCKECSNPVCPKHSNVKCNKCE